MIRKVFITAVLLALIASLAYAQRGGGGQGSGGDQAGGSPGGGRGPANDKSAAMAKEFKLTPDQKAAFEAIMDDAQKQSTPILTQILEQKNAMLKLCMDGKDSGDITQKLAQLNAQALAIEVDAFSKVLAKLDDKQKSKAPQLFDEMAGIFGAQGGWRRSY